MRVSFAGVVTHIVATAAVSIAYAISFYLVFWVSNWIQGHLAVNLIYGSVIFFPHGIRVIAAYLFGWWSLLYLLPISLFFADPALGGFLHAKSIILALASPASAVISFELLAKLGVIERQYLSASIHWKSLILAGAVAAFFNAISHAALQVGKLRDWSAIAIGDVVGFLFVLIFAFALFKAHSFWVDR